MHHFGTGMSLALDLYSNILKRKHRAFVFMRIVRVPRSLSVAIRLQEFRTMPAAALEDATSASTTGPPAIQSSQAATTSPLSKNAPASSAGMPQSVLQPQRPSSTAVHLFSSTPDAMSVALSPSGTFRAVGSSRWVTSSSIVPEELGLNFAVTTNVLVPNAAQSSHFVAASSLTDDPPAGNTSTSIHEGGVAITSKAQPRYEKSVQTLATVAKTTHRTGTLAEGSNLESPKVGTVLTHGISTSIASQTAEGLVPSTQSTTGNSKSSFIIPVRQTVSLGSSVTLSLTNSRSVLELRNAGNRATLTNVLSNSLIGTGFIGLPALVIGSQTITANARSGYVIVDGQSLASGSTTSMGSGTSTTPVLQTASTQTFLASNSSTPPSSDITTAPALPQTPAFLTIGGNTIIANSLDQYNVGGQTLSPGAVITVSGTTISLAPGASDVIVGTSTEALRPHATAGFSSSPNGTKVQMFRGSAPGVRNELWGSAVLIWVGIAILLRL